MQILDNGNVRITNRRTGEMKDVSPNDLGQYNIPMDAYLKLKGNSPSASFTPSGNRVTDLQGAMRPGVGYSVADVKAYQEAKDKETDPYGLNAIREQGNLRNSMALEETRKKKQDDLLIKAQEKLDFQNNVKSKSQAVVDIISKKDTMSPEQYRTALNLAASDFNTTSKLGREGPAGKALTGTELGILIGSMVSTEPPRKQNILQQLTGEVPAATGNVIDPDDVIVQKMNMIMGKPMVPSAKPSEQSSGVGGLLSNAGRDAKDIANGLLNIPKTVVDYTKDKVSKGQFTIPGAIGDAAMGLGKGIINEGNELLGRPLEGGDIVGRIADRAYNKPVTTLLDILPFIKGAKVSKGTGAVVGGSGPPPPPGGGGPFTKGVLPKIGEGMQKVATDLQELKSGGGTKPLIAKNVMLGGSEDLSRSLQGENILSSVTEKGKIQQTQKALTDVGRSISKEYKNSKFTISENDLFSKPGGLEDTLLKKYAQGKPFAEAAPEVRQSIMAIKEQLSSVGNPSKTDILNNVLKAEDLYNMKVVGEKFGPSAYNLPNGPLISEMAKDSTSYLRSLLEEKVPEAVPHLRRYGNLKTYMDDILDDPTKRDTAQSVSGGVVKTVGNAIVTPVSRAVDYGLQKMYNLGNRFIGDSLPEISPKGSVPKATPINNILRSTAESEANSARMADQGVVSSGVFDDMANNSGLNKSEFSSLVKSVQKKVNSGSFDYSKLSPKERRMMEQIVKSDIDKGIISVNDANPYDSVIDRLSNAPKRGTSVRPNKSILPRINSAIENSKADSLDTLNSMYEPNSLRSSLISDMVEMGYKESQLTLLSDIELQKLFKKVK